MISSTTVMAIPAIRLPKYPQTLFPSTKRTSNCHVSSSLASDQASRGSASGSGYSPPPDLRIVFAGGGAGGHVYPSIAIADEIKNSHPSAGFLFVGTTEGMESTAVPKAGYDFAAIPPAPLSRPSLSPANLLLPLRFLRSVASSWRILRDFRPQVVVGTGGYVAAPVFLAALLAGIKIVVQEQNGYPGLTNRIIAPYAVIIFTAFNACVKHLPKEKCLVYGNPVRLSLRRYISKAVARSHFFPKAEKVGEQKVLLILGGSSGAQAINFAVLNMYYDMLSEHKNWFIIWQTGVDGYSEMESLVKNHHRLLLTPFLHAMHLAYAAADVVITRAGAMICTEIITTGKPSILIPSPVAVDVYQTNNAYIMEDIAGSKVITEDELDSSNLEIAISDVLGNENLMAEMSEKALKVALPNAAANIAQCILSLVKVSSSG